MARKVAPMLENSAEITGERHLLSKETRRFIRVFTSRSLVVVGVVIILLFLITAIFAPVLTPYDPYVQNLKESLLQPGKKGHILGTDAIGRDILSRIIYGARTSLIVGVVSVLIAALIGLTLGLIAGFYGSLVNTIIMRFIDSMMSIPMILLALVIAALLGSGLTNVMIAIGVSMMSVYARMMCGQVLSVKENDFITAERAIGASNFRIMFRHLLPNCFSPLIVIITMQFGTAILAEAGLSFLGVGIEPPIAAWGAMVNDGYKYLLTIPVLSLVPGVTIIAVVFAFNMVGDGLRDALDPRLRGLI
jgi:ABC-type dipeptide/oligopeptide/nickel transport system permease subunit